MFEEEERAMLTLPSSEKVQETERKPVITSELLKCIPLKNSTEKDDKMCDRVRYLACVAVADGEGSIGIGEKIANSRMLAESKAREEALKNFRFVEKQVNTTVSAKCQDVSLRISPADPGSVCHGSLLTKKILKMIGISNCFIAGADNTLSTIKAFNKALRKLTSVFLLLYEIFSGKD